MKNLEINPIGIEQSESLKAPSSKDVGGFAEALQGAVQKVDQLQMDADGEAMKVANGEGNLHELSLSMEKADVAMRTAVKARNKLVDAYNEVMRMSV